MFHFLFSHSSKTRHWHNTACKIYTQGEPPDGNTLTACFLLSSPSPFPFAHAFRPSFHMPTEKKKGEEKRSKHKNKKAKKKKEKERKGKNSTSFFAAFATFCLRLSSTSKRCLQAERKTFVTVSMSFAVHSTYLTALISFARFSPVLASMGFWLPSSSRTLGSFWQKKKKMKRNSD